MFKECHLLRIAAIVDAIPWILAQVAKGEQLVAVPVRPHLAFGETTANLGLRISQSNQGTHHYQGLPGCQKKGTYSTRFFAPCSGWQNVAKESKEHQLVQVLEFHQQVQPLFGLNLFARVYAKGFSGLMIQIQKCQPEGPKFAPCWRMLTDHGGRRPVVTPSRLVKSVWECLICKSHLDPLGPT